MAARFRYFLPWLPMEGDMPTNSQLAALFRSREKNARRLGAMKWVVDAWRSRDLYKREGEALCPL